MKLRELDAQLYRFEGPRTFARVEPLAEADSVMFLCPACFVTNNGRVGTHRVRVDFAGRGVPDDVCIHNAQGQPVRWTAEGSSIDDLTLRPSILLLGGCGWHGFVTNGDAA